MTRAKKTKAPKPPPTVFVLQEDDRYQLGNVIAAFYSLEEAEAGKKAYPNQETSIFEVAWHGPAFVKSKHGLNAGQFQAWRTPKPIFEAAQETLEAVEGQRFNIDAFADADNALCAAYFDGTKGRDGFVRKWKGFVWANPPYGGACQERCLDKAIAEVDAGRCSGACLLVQANVSSKWFHRAAKRCVIEPYQGRIQFDLPPGVPNARRSSFSNVLIWVWPQGTAVTTGVGRSRNAKTGAYV